MKSTKIYGMILGNVGSNGRPDTVKTSSVWAAQRKSRKWLQTMSIVRFLRTLLECISPETIGFTVELILQQKETNQEGHGEVVKGFRDYVPEYGNICGIDSVYIWSADGNGAL